MFDYYVSQLKEKIRAAKQEKLKLGFLVVVVAACVWIFWLSAAQSSRGLRVIDEAASNSEQGEQADQARSADAGRRVVRSSSEGAIYVHVAGAVSSPGLYDIPSSSRVKQAIDVAGGMLASADATGVNLARKLKDGEQLIVPFMLPPPSGVVSTAGLPAASGRSEATAGTTATSGGQVDLNQATAVELDSVPGIGPVIAERIVEYRETHGPFGSVEELRNVSGIGDKKYEDMAGTLVVR